MECKVTARKYHYPKDVPFAVPEGWVWTTLDELAIYKKGPFGSSLTKSMFVPDYEHSYKIYEQKNAICKDAFIGNYYIDEEKYKSMSSFEVFPGDTIVSCAGTIGETYTLPHGIRKGIINQALMIIRLYNQSIRPYYLLYFDYFLKTQAETDSKGTAIKNIPPFDILKSYLIPFPPLAEQIRITETCEKLFQQLQQIDNEEGSLRLKIDAIKNRILEYAVYGKLVSQDPSDEPAIELLRRVNPSFQPSDNLHYEGSLPSGWTLCCLEDILDYEQPQAYMVSSTDYSDDYKTPVLTPGKSFILGYTNEVSGICNRLPVIIFDDFTTESKYVDFPFKVKSSAMKILHPRGEINLLYIALFMSITRLAGNTHKRYWISEYSKIPIPLPPLAEQIRIVEKVNGLYSALSALKLD